MINNLGYYLYVIDMIVNIKLVVNKFEKNKHRKKKKKVDFQEYINIIYNKNIYIYDSIQIHLHRLLHNSIRTHHQDPRKVHQDT